MSEVLTLYVNESVVSVVFFDLVHVCTRSVHLLYSLLHGNCCHPAFSGLANLLGVGIVKSSCFSGVYDKG